MFRKSGYRFSDKNMRQRKRMFRKSGYRFFDKNMRQRKRMFRKSGYRFSDKNMRQRKRSRAYSDPFDRNMLERFGSTESMVRRKKGRVKKSPRGGGGDTGLFRNAAVGVRLPPPRLAPPRLARVSARACRPSCRSPGREPRKTRPSR